MLFNSVSFFIFFSIFFLGYVFSKGMIRTSLCLIASYVFYGWWDWRFLFLIFLSTGIDYAVGLFLDQTKSAFNKKALLWLSLCVNLGILCFFKYYNFFVSSLVSLFDTLGFGSSFQTLKIILPVGISFYTFQKLSYTIDIYRGTLKAESNFINFATFVAFFPQLVAGPIIRASHLLPQIKEDRQLSWNQTMHGMAQVIWGFFKKVAVADSLSPFVSAIFNNPTSHSSVTIMVAIVFFSIQIYCDFSGYSDIAIGLARIMGFDFPRNFHLPYFSKSFSEFWQRWHMSLSFWLKDYLYIPLGGNRHGMFKTLRNLMITMLLGGLWHGASWTFIIWGGLHGVFLIIQRLMSRYNQRVIRLMHLPDFITNLFFTGFVFALTSFAWVFFRAPTLDEAWLICQGLAAMSFDLSSIPHTFVFMKGLLMIIILMSLELIYAKTSFFAIAIRQPMYRMALFSLGILLITLFGTFDAPFIYFQF